MKGEERERSALEESAPSPIDATEDEEEVTFCHHNHDHYFP